MDEAAYSLALAKEDFKFSAAHFTLFPDGTAEPLHGHNYRVRVWASGPSLGDHGLLCDVAALKAQIRSSCARLDDKILIPEKAATLELRAEGDDLEVHFGERSYRMPRAEVVLLPLENVTMELLARMIFGEIAAPLAGSGVRRLRVEVEETAGQGASYEARLS